jgi:hypothetical protein
VDREEAEHALAAAALIIEAAHQMIDHLGLF